MSYLVLARKWRPQTFDDLVGQESVVRTIKNAISQKRVAHAYVFSGPRGVGKTTTARLLSKALNCVEGPTAEPCGVCNSCQAITNGSDVDVIEIDGASNNSVNDIRNLRETVQYAPAMGRYKIYIIDEVHMLSDSAFNALLKTLEEPPTHVFFIFATTSPRKIPVTVLSRCQHLGFKRVPKALIVQHLRRICDAETLDANNGALEMLARQAGGSVRDSLTLLDQASAFSDRITEGDLVAMLGLPEAGVLREITESVLAGDRAGILGLVAKLAESGADLRVFPKELATIARNLLVASVVGDDRDLLDLPDEELAWVKRTAAGAKGEQLTLTLEEFLRLAGEMREGTVPRYVLELGLIRASFFRGVTSFDTLIDNLEKGSGIRRDLPARGSAGEAVEGKAEPSTSRIRSTGMGAVREPGNPYQASGEGGESGEETTLEVSDEGGYEHEADPRGPSPGDPGDISATDLWRRVQGSLEKEGGLLPSLLASFRPTALNNGVLEIEPNAGVNGFTVEKVEAESSAIERVLSSILARPARFRIGKPAPGSPEPVEPATDSRDSALNHPMVKSAMELFEGRVTDVRLSGSDA